MKREQLFRAVIILLALVGLAASLYLFKEHLAPSGNSFCDLSQRISCDVVNQSQYAELFGIPVALLGSLHYLLLIFALLFMRPLLRLLSLERRLFYLLLFLELLFSLLFSLYLTGVEAFILHVYCPLCVLSALITLAHFLMALALWRLTPFGDRERSTG